MSTTNVIEGTITELYANENEENRPCRIKLDCMNEYISFWNIRDGPNLKDTVPHDFKIGDKVKIDYYVNKKNYLNGTSIIKVDENNNKEPQQELNIESDKSETKSKAISILQNIKQQVDDVINELSNN